MLTFPPFRLDAGEERLWKGAKLLAVRRKPFAILRYLVANPRRLVTHDELLKEVWGGSVVSESSVRSHLHELRQVLGEGVIETVIGRGYRFTQEVTQDAEVSASAPVALPDRLLVGRTRELDALRAALDKAKTGTRQLVFITGEPGIGKTMLVDAFVDELAGVVAVRGQSVEQHSTPEPYRPVIEMIAQLRHSKIGDQALAALLRFAPTFLSHIPQLIPDDKLDDVMRRAGGGNEAKMVRELIEALETICINEPLVVVLEDLQWSDVATIDLLYALGQRRERAKLLVIATSRRAEAQTPTHPLNRVMRPLVARGFATGVSVDRFEDEDIANLVAARFPGHAFPPAFLQTIDSITNGTPLFVTAILDDLVARGMIKDGALTVAIGDVAAHRPDNVKQLIDVQLDRLAPTEQRLLEVASTVGPVFATALVAAALEISVEDADELCDSLARRSLFLQHEGTDDWPDGSQQSCYGFTHGLVQEVCADRSAPARRQRWHRAIAEKLEAAYDDRAGEISSKLAAHYEKAQQLKRAIHFHRSAAARAVARFATADAMPSLQRALELLHRMPENRERDVEELQILGSLGSLVLRKPSDAGESLGQFERMVTIARRLDDVAGLCSSLFNLSVRYTTLAQYDKALQVNAELEAVAPPAFASAIDTARAMPLIWKGRFGEAIPILERIADSELETDTRLGILDPLARKTTLTGYLGACYGLVGDTERGIATMQKAYAIAMQTRDPFTLGLTIVNEARLRILRGEPAELIRMAAERVLALPDATMWHAQAWSLVGWARSVQAPLPQADIDEMVRRFRERASDVPMGTSYVATGLVEALRRSNKRAEAISLADETLVTLRARGELMFEAEVLRVCGDVHEDPAFYREAIERATAVGTHLLALRAAVSLGDAAAIARVLPNVVDKDTPLVREALSKR